MLSVSKYSRQDKLQEIHCRHGAHLIQNLTEKDFERKAICELKLPKNMKFTDQKYQAPQFQTPMPNDDDVIVSVE